MKKSFAVTLIFVVLLLIIILLNFSYLNPYNFELFHPIFSALFPIAFLVFFSSSLKNINTKYFFRTLVVFLFIEFIILSGIDSTCSQIVCYDRNSSALILSSLFSIIYFIVLFIKNKKQYTLVK